MKGHSKVPSSSIMDDADASPLVNPVSRKKALEVFAGTDNAYKLAKKYGVGSTRTIYLILEKYRRELDPS